MSPNAHCRSRSRTLHARPKALCARSAQPQSAMLQQKSSNQTHGHSNASRRRAAGPNCFKQAVPKKPQPGSPQKPPAPRPQMVHGWPQTCPATQFGHTFTDSSHIHHQEFTQWLRWRLPELLLRPESQQQQQQRCWQQHLPVPSTPAGSSLAKRGMKQPGTWPSAPGSGGTAGR